MTETNLLQAFCLLWAILEVGNTMGQGGQQVQAEQDNSQKWGLQASLEPMKE